MYPFIVTSLACGVVAYTIPLCTLKTAARYFAMMLMPSVNSEPQIYLKDDQALLTMQSSPAIPQIMIYKTMNLHMARPYPKRAAGVAMINSIGGLSNIWASYLYYDGPHYYAAFGGGTSKHSPKCFYFWI